MSPTNRLPAVVSVSDLRRELAGAAEPGAGAPSTALLGEIFHEVGAGLWNPRSGQNWARTLGEDELASSSRLQQSAYTALVGPRLSRYQAALQSSSQEVLHFWMAVGEFCRWSCTVLSAARDRGLVRWDPREERWLNAEQLVSVEQELGCEFAEPNWTRRVRVVGVADAILRKPTGEWCVIEYKLGRGAPEADLAQAALYYELLCNGSEDGVLALVRFLPHVDERVFSGAALRDARKALRTLAGKVAGVLPGQAIPPSPPAPAPAGTRWADLVQELERTLAEHGAPGKVVSGPVEGPAFLRFYVEAARGVGVGRALRLPLDLQVRLKLSSPPFVHIQGGRLAIDVQRPDRRSVSFGEVEGQLPAADPAVGSSAVPVGIDLNGKLRCADLADPVNTHILVAGTTGSGKSEWLRSALAGLIARNTPDTLRLMLIDPKRNAFADLASSSFLLRPVVYPPEHSAVQALESLVTEMERRYELMSGADSIASFVQRTGQRTPRIVCVCDEYADLVLASRADRRSIEELISRLGSKARAAGIHLILATQQPSRNIIGGPLVANLPARVSLKTNSPIESRMVILEGGAENLLGHGDLLFRDVGRPERLQGVLLGDDERRQWFGGQPIMRAAG